MSTIPQTSPVSAAAIAGNDLLSALRQPDLALLEAKLGECRLKAGEIIYNPGDSVEYCYFPTEGAMSSYFVEMDDGMAVETILVGREGALGGIVSHGSLPAYARANVLHEGTFLRISARDLEAAKEQSPAISRLFARYADCVMAQVFQSIACNDVTMTQEQLASMMGIGRSYASRVLQRFKREGMVRTRRGGIEVLDRGSLKDRACVCNEQVEGHFRRVLGEVYPREG